jgi:hypothetical protein
MRGYDKPLAGCLSVQVDRMIGSKPRMISNLGDMSYGENLQQQQQQQQQC